MNMSFEDLKKRQKSVFGRQLLESLILDNQTSFRET